MDFHLQPISESVAQALAFVGILQSDGAAKMRRRISDLSWGGWAILAAIIAPAMAGAFFAGKAVSSVETLSLRLTHELEVRDLKLDYVYQQMTLGERFTEEDGDRLESMIMQVSVECRNHIQNAGPLIQKLDILWARAALDTVYPSEMLDGAH